MPCFSNNRANTVQLRYKAIFECTQVQMHLGLARYLDQHIKYYHALCKKPENASRSGIHVDASEIHLKATLYLATVTCIKITTANVI